MSIAININLVKKILILLLIFLFFLAVVIYMKEKLGPEMKIIPAGFSIISSIPIFNGLNKKSGKKKGTIPWELIIIVIIALVTLAFSLSLLKIDPKAIIGIAVK